MNHDQNTFHSLLTAQLREQIGSIMAASQLLSPAIRACGAEKYGHYLSILNQSTYRLLRLTEQAEFMDQGEELSFRPVPVELTALCRDLSRQVSGLADLLGTDFLYDGPDLPLWTEGDPLLLGRMLLNLISNALEAAGKGGRAGLRLARSGKQVCLTVWDNGTGDRFPTGPSASEVPDLQPGGLGLGVQIARTIALRHGGALLFERGEGDRGLRAAVSLPLAPAGTRLCAPDLGLDPSGGLSQVLVELSGLLPWEAYSAEDLE